MRSTEIADMNADEPSSQRGVIVCSGDGKREYDELIVKCKSK